VRAALKGLEDQLLDAGAVRARADALASIATGLEDVDHSLRGPAGLHCLLSEPGLIDAIAARTQSIGSRIAALESLLDSGCWRVGPDYQEKVNATMVRLKDAWWAIDRDRLATARGVADLIGEQSGQPNLDAWWAIQFALAALDHLEVRGRDSAGLHVLIGSHGLDPSAPDVVELIGSRTGDDLFTSGAVCITPECLSIVYKAAAVIGELGDNVKALRSAIRSDCLLARALASHDASVTVIGHTRWASVGTISEPNAHPLNSDEVDRSGAPYVVAALNGDIDNHVTLRGAESLAPPAEITTDAKIIPTIISRRLADGLTIDEAFRQTVSRFDGSVAIVASSALSPDSLHLATCGSGQSLYIGLANDAYVVASEPYGLVEETSHYLRMDGASTQGQVVVLRRDRAGSVDGMIRSRYSGTLLPIEQREMVTAEITTRDIDRRGFQHFLLKELTDAPGSFRKTLRGRFETGASGRLRVRLGEDTIPTALAEDLADGAIKKVFVIGQGTAAVAGQAVASALARCLPELTVTPLPATELSGYGLADDMSDTLVVAISQSGTTTDTNRTVDLVRTRGACVVAVVNRRNSDLVTKAHGVIYTSDGRDIELSVASTKAFYAQVAAGWILAVGLAQAAGHDGSAMHDGLDPLLAALRELPTSMEQVLGAREDIERIAGEVVPHHRYWAVVGSGPERIAAAELRIKLSELCYRAVANDATEDKKHIDLSSEPLILVCGSGIGGRLADDVAKEVAIFVAHQATPIIITTEAEADRFRSMGRHVITVPETDPVLAFVLSAMAGHLFGYYAARSIDVSAQPLRAARAIVIGALAGQENDLLHRASSDLARERQSFEIDLNNGTYNGNLKPATAVNLSLLLRYASGALPIEAYEHESGRLATPTSVLSDLLATLNTAIGELTRPIDAVKHQAKTVTVGISRSEKALLSVPLVKAVLAAGAGPDILGYRTLRTLEALDEAVGETLGYTRYRIDQATAGEPTVAVVEQGGIAKNLCSRTCRDPRLRGAKNRAAAEREVTVAVGASDGRTIILVPEVKDNRTVGMTLLHVRFRQALPAQAAKRVLRHYRNRYAALVDAVMETETFDDSYLARDTILALLTEPVSYLAERWKNGPMPQIISAA
jgi:glucosamine--fructose-6-phosphate aminotransferase (isomerizing)